MYANMYGSSTMVALTSTMGTYNLCIYMFGLYLFCIYNFLSLLLFCLYIS